jgi:hypothetical protein
MASSRPWNASLWRHLSLLVIQLILVLLLLGGGCHSSQHYEVVSPQSADELLNKCDVVIEGRITQVSDSREPSLLQSLFFCFTFDLRPGACRPDSLLRHH